jgi:hypothetical protein
MDDHRVMGLDPTNSDLQILAPTGTSIQLVDYTKSNSGLEVTSSFKVDFTGNTSNPLVDISNSSISLNANQNTPITLFTQGNGEINLTSGGSNPRNDINVDGRIIQYEPGSLPNSLKDTNITGSLRSTNIIGTGSLYLQPDQGDARFLEVYNTSPTDTHITASGGQIFLGNDVTYVKVDNYGSVKHIDIVADNGVNISGSLNVTGSLLNVQTYGTNNGVNIIDVDGNGSASFVLSESSGQYPGLDLYTRPDVYNDPGNGNGYYGFISIDPIDITNPNTPDPNRSIGLNSTNYYSTGTGTWYGSLYGGQGGAAILGVNDDVDTVLTDRPWNFTNKITGSLRVNNIRVDNAVSFTSSIFSPNVSASMYLQQLNTYEWAFNQFDNNDFNTGTQLIARTNKDDGITSVLLKARYTGQTDADITVQNTSSGLRTAVFNVDNTIISGSLGVTNIDNTTITSEGDVSMDGGSNVFYTNAPGPVLQYFINNQMTTGVTVNGLGVSNATITGYNQGDPYMEITLSSGTVTNGATYGFTGLYPTPLSINADKLNITGSVYSSNGYYSPAGLTLQNADGSGGQYPNININVDSSTYEGNIYAGLSINDASGKDGGKFIMTTYGPYNDNVPIIGGGGQYNGDDTAIGFYSGSIDMWKPTRFRALITGSLTISGKTTMSNSTNFPLQVNGTIQSQRFSFVGNPFNTNTGSVFGSLNYEGGNNTLQFTNGDFGTPGTASYVYLTTQTGSNTTTVTNGAGYAGKIAQTTLTNNNGSRSFNVQVDSTSITGSLNVTGSLKVSGNIQFASGSNKTMGTVTLDGGNPGTATVSNSLVTANSIIFLTKQTFVDTNSRGVAVVSKGSGTFTISSGHNGDSDTVGYLIINPA